jgi:hypothetical protein
MFLMNRFIIWGLNIFALLQAVESQRLRKRRRDERRLLDMQRRQKQRVEEVRETQKKVWILYYRFIVSSFCKASLH